MSKKITTEDFIAKSILVHGDRYGYTMSEYIGRGLPVDILCPVHGVFSQAPHNHDRGHGCPKCGNIKISEKKRKSQDDFIKDALKVHGDKYGYSLVRYEGSKRKVRIICAIHGEFTQSPQTHLIGRGCSKCGDLSASKKLSMGLEGFIKKALEIHKNKYAYSHVEYVSVFHKVEIVCPLHGEFKQTPHSHLKGSGCPICKRASISIKLNKGAFFVKKATEVHGGKYDYSKSLYIHSKRVVEIICPKHGSFFQKPTKHLSGQGCSQCGSEEGNFKFKDTTESFVNKAIEIHGERYDYSKVEYKNSDSKVLVVCPKHGIFVQAPTAHLMGQGCPKCKEPYGEKFIERYLTTHNVVFERQKKFDGCLDKRLLPFDFFIPISNTCIEYDGIQHFHPYPRFGGEVGFREMRRRDSIKNEFCLTCGIRLIRVSYDTPKAVFREILQRAIS